MSDRGTIQRCRRVLEGLLGVPATEGNRVDVLRNGDEIFPAMLDAIGDARSTIDMLTFIYWTGSIAQRMANTLTDRADADVRVRVLLDAFGARLMDRDLVQRMEGAGATVRFFRPPTYWARISDSMHRTHRKVLICDEEVAFTGGVGIAEEWEGDARHPGEWRDTHFRFRGPAVDGLRAAFANNWAETGPFFDDRDRFPEQPRCGDSVVQILRGEAQYGWSDVTTLKRTLVELAQRRLRITSAYFSPDDVMVQLLCRAAQRGVEVDVLVPGRHADKRVAQLAGEQAYERLLDTGIRIWNYQRTMLHAKIVAVDGLIADVGSSNFNSRSFSEDDEVDAVIFDPEVAGILDSHFDEDLRDSEAIEPGRWDDRSVKQRALERLTALIADRI
ncbi:MAG TPA: phospholipase D-like domain-containing protein [Nitriliruptorales bacterium]|nr:phospholipase D-like domain-containing protein [Nitriliruptorales bacterium]